ncbi:hypothetical protein BGZ83_000923 [Gryganskiella cystojenkinii]|nr:hypothetical protein BGZ83_000923 [Gryganskiella cystojenkinii]
MAQKPFETEANEALLRIAAKTVDDQLGRELKYPDLGELFNSDYSATYVAPNPSQQILRRKRAISLPDTLFEHGQYESYEELDQVIVNVAIVKPKSDTFDDKVEYLLVIATPIEVHLLGVATGSGSTPHTLYLTNMSVPTDNITMRSIVGTAEGRIFMNGNDGRLWEIEYQAEEGWFSKKCSKKELIGSSLSYFIPTFLNKIRVDAIVKVIFDQSRQTMYGLTEHSNIEVIDLVSGADKRGIPTQRCTLKAGTILQEGKRKSNHHRTMDESTFKIVDIHVIPATESRDVCLVAVTATGCRLYFGQRMTMDYNQRQTDSTISGPNLLHVRIPPTFEGAPEGILGPQGQYQIHQSIYCNGVFLAAHALTDAADALIASAPDSGPINKASTSSKTIGSSYIPRMTEMAMISGIEGKIWAMAEVPGVEYAGSIDPSVLRNELAIQLSRSAREYLVLTNSAGPVAAYAERLLLEWGGKRSQAESAANDRMMSPSQVGSELGRPVSQSTTRQLTYRHSGLSLYIARLLRPIWKRRVIKTVDINRGQFDSEISDVVLTSVQKDLIALRAFLSASVELFMPRPVVSSNPPGEKDQIEIENANVETKSLQALAKLLTQCIEGIAFVLFLIDSKMSETISNISIDSRQVFNGITYETLLTTSKGHDLCRELVTAVINKQMGHHMSVDAVSDTLQRICGSFCNPGDVLFYKAMEHLRQSKSSLDPADVEDHARESLRLFKKVPFLLVDESHGLNKLHAICKEYMDIKFFTGAVELALSCAQDIDPSNKAAGYAKDGRNSKDPRVEQYSQRLICYENTVSVLKGLGLDSAQGPLSNFACHTLETALAFDDSLFHTYLYDWLLSHNRVDYLLEINSPYIEDYLRQCTELDATRDLLWRYYVKVDDFGHAAEELGRIAESTRYKLDFDSRLEYLSLAVSNAKSCPAGSDPKSENGRLLIELEEKLEVGNIQLDIIQHLKAAAEEHARQMNNGALNATERQESRQKALALDNMYQSCKAQLLDVTNLYHTYVEPVKMYESMLAIFHASDTDDEYHVRAAWEGYIARVFLESEDSSRNPLTDIEVRIKDLGRRFYPSAKVTPLSILVQVLERYPYLKQTARYQSPPGWAVRILREIGFPFEAIFDNFHALIETKKNEWIGPRASLVLIQDIEFLLRVWLAERYGAGIISELNNELGVVEDEFMTYSGAHLRNGSGGSPSLALGASSLGSLDQFRTRKVEEAIQVYIRILESASWTPTPISGAFDENMGGSEHELRNKAAKLVQRLQAIHVRIHRLR